MATQRWTRGAIVKVPLGPSRHSYAQMLEAPEYAFFAVDTGEELAPADVIAKPVLFRLWVMNRAHTKGRWAKIGVAGIRPELVAKVGRFNQDPLKPSSIVITYGGHSIHSATRDECVALERAAVWDPEHAEDRLRDHFAGRPNQWAESLRLK